MYMRDLLETALVQLQESNLDRDEKVKNIGYKIRSSHQ